MSIPAHINLPKTPEAQSVRKYVTFQHTKDFSKGDQIFTDDVVFNGLLYKVNGKEQLVAGFQDFVDNMLTSIRVEAVNEVGSPDKYLLLHFVKMTGSDKEVPTVDLISLKGGKICRIDNCFDTAKVPNVVKEDAQKVSTT